MHARTPLSFQAQRFQRSRSCCAPDPDPQHNLYNLPRVRCAVLAPPWLQAQHDLDNLRLADVPEPVAHAELELAALMLTGSCIDVTAGGNRAVSCLRRARHGHQPRSNEHACVLRSGLALCGPRRAATSAVALAPAVTMHAVGCGPGPACALGRP